MREGESEERERRERERARVCVKSKCGSERNAYAGGLLLLGTGLSLGLLLCYHPLQPVRLSAYSFQ
jgi:hypothetical protein